MKGGGSDTTDLVEIVFHESGCRNLVSTEVVFGLDFVGGSSDSSKFHLSTLSLFTLLMINSVTIHCERRTKCPSLSVGVKEMENSLPQSNLLMILWKVEFTTRC